MQIIKFHNQDIQVSPRDEADVSVVREIFKLREYKATEAVIVGAVDPIVDVGAHAGLFTLYCRALNKRVKIFAIEPEAKNITALGAHLATNHVSDVKVAVGALSGKTGEMLLKISEDSHNHRILPDGVVSDPSDMAKITTWTLRDFCAKNKIKNISLLKMDIEGAEFEVFASLAPEDYLLFKNVILEYHDNRQRNHHLIESLLRENGFGVQKFPSKFDKTMGFIFANNKRLK
ncbi:MAG: hypothetical protein A2261_03590 [Candidatus Magasanikbacteria bacterium RIFOXYA2_FULL_44_8]|uniref:Methyltransferase FkbM domain-containing protein n=1 Tax=Candidatus Magasanikbacteria bacterium RIFOXYA2_FULL_44_8 TaxID=1798696 RepID=A0A1F6NKM4_9BACT|nr:MAG: hypothetical protein A2261_03590 [Candidatus Magasanikbacteria bacterium RIFOXYA2_FULL_44_8]